MKIILRSFKILLLFISFAFIFVASASANERPSKEYLRNYIAESLYLGLERIDMSAFGCKKEFVFDAIDYVVKTNPELYYLGESFYYSLSANGNVEEIIPTYLYNARERENIKKFCDRELEKILFTLDIGMSDFDIALELHEYLCDNFTYDDSLENSAMFELLRDGRGTCQAFTLTYMELLSRSGIKSSYAYSDQIRHVWNLIELDGEYFHVDITWDIASDGVKHTNFLLNDTEIIATGHVGFVSPDGIQCKSEKYSSLALRGNLNKHEYFEDGFLYVDNEKRGVYFDALDGNDAICLYTIEGLWRKAEGRYFANSFSSLVIAGDKAYFNTKNKIMQIDHALSVSEAFELSFEAFGLDEAAGGLSCRLDREGKEKRSVVLERSFDADGDGEVGVLDILALSRYIHDMSGFVYKYNVDYNADRRLDTEDLRRLENALLA